MRRITRYIFSQLALATLFVTFAVTFAIWLAQSLRLIDYMVNRGLPASSFLELILLLLPSFLGVVLPIAAVVATLFVYNKLTQDSELVVMRTSGLSPMGLARPALLLAVVVTLLVYSVTLYFMPLSFRAFKDLQNEVRQSYASVLIQEGIFNTFGSNVTVYVRQRDEEGALRGIIVHDARLKAKPVTLTAERGALVATPEGPRVLLVNGNRQEIDQMTGQVSVLYFDQYSLDLAALDQQQHDRWREPQERYLHELFWPEVEPDTPQRWIDELYAEGHQRLVAPLYVIAYVLIGLVAMLTGEFNRRGRPRRLLAAAAAVALLQGIAFFLQDFVNRFVAAVPLMYIVPSLAIVLCLILLLLPARRRARPQTEAAA